jgi:hypothetical protein
MPENVFEMWRISRIGAVSGDGGMSTSSAVTGITVPSAGSGTEVEEQGHGGGAEYSGHRAEAAKQFFQRAASDAAEAQMPHQCVQRGTTKRLHPGHASAARIEPEHAGGLVVVPLAGGAHQASPRGFSDATQPLEHEAEIFMPDAHQMGALSNQPRGHQKRFLQTVLDVLSSNELAY